MKPQIKFFVFLFTLFTLGAILFSQNLILVQANQNPSPPSPPRCHASIWSIGLPSGVTCKSNVSISLSGIAGFLGQNTRIRPDLTSVNQFCKQYTGDSTAYAISASVHNYCNGCDQYLAYWTGSSWYKYQVCAGNLNVQNLTCGRQCSSCTPRYTKKCVGNAVYWFNSCDQQEELYQTCSSNQICQDGQCRTVACNRNSDCGTDGWIGSPYCKLGDQTNVYQKYRTYICRNPGTPSSYCNYTDEERIKETCPSNQKCQSGQCVTSCTPRYTKKCVGNAVYWFNSCDQQEELYQTCSSNQICQDGQCRTVACNRNSDCGTDGWIGSPYCRGNNVYQNYIIYTCNNPNTPNSYCSSNFEERLKQTCSSNQICRNGTCTPAPLVCTPYFYKRCVGNNLYWFDSCNNQGPLYQYCPYGCQFDRCVESTQISVQTNNPTNVSSTQATLNGYLDNPNSNCNVQVWFEYGPNPNFGYTTPYQSRNSSGTFSEVVTLYGNYSTYYVRTVARDCRNNTLYGQTLSFTVSNPTVSNLNVNVTVKNLNTGTGFANSISANPLDMLLFMITLNNPGNQQINNLSLRDYLPANLIYKNQLIVSGVSYSGDITTGLNIPSLSAGQTATITYQAQVAPAINFSYGTTTLRTNLIATASNISSVPVNNASIFVTRAAVLGAATSVVTGLTNNFFLDSFFLPLIITLLIIWMWRKGFFYGLEKWLDKKTNNYKAYKSEKELNKKIEFIKRIEQ